MSTTNTKEPLGQKENPGRKRAMVDASDIFWVICFIFVIHKFDLVDAVRYDLRIHRSFLLASLVSMSVCILIALYCIVWVIFIKKVEKFDKHSPWAAPVMTVTGLLSWLWFAIAIWPVWGWMTLFIIPCLFMGCLVLLTLVPI